MQPSLPYKRWPAIVWIVLAPVIALAAAISTVDSLEVYYIQLLVAAAISCFGLAGGVAFLFKIDKARHVLIILSWMLCIYFLGSGTLFALYSLVLSDANHSFKDVFFYLVL